MVGAFSFANLFKVLPIMSGTGIDEEAALGNKIEADSVVNTYTQQDGETGKRKDITKMYLAG